MNVPFGVNAFEKRAEVDFAMLLVLEKPAYRWCAVVVVQNIFCSFDLAGGSVPKKIVAIIQEAACKVDCVHHRDDQH